MVPQKDWNQRYLDNDIAWDSDIFSIEIEKRYQEWHLSPQSHPRVLDVGCGTGTNAIEIPTRGRPDVARRAAEPIVEAEGQLTDSLLTA